MKQRHLTNGQHRLQMAQRAFASVPEAVVSDCEIRRSGTTYTIDTLRELQQTLEHTPPVPPPVQMAWYLIMGQDLLAGLPQWQRAQELFAQVCVAVLERPDSAASGSDEHGHASQPQMTAASTEAVSDVASNAASNTPSNAISGTAEWGMPTAVTTTLARIQQALPALRTTRLQAPASTISSTHIRQGLQHIPANDTDTRLQWLHNLVPDAVAHYIVQHQLYTSS